MTDLRSRIVGRVRFTTDGDWAYLQAVDGAFGGDMDYGQFVKIYGHTSTNTDAARRYSQAECISAKKHDIIGRPDAAHISTSYVERSNLTMRTFMKRFARLSLGFSKKIEHHAYMVALYTVWYNFIKMHKTLKMTPAIAAGVSDHLMDMSELVALMDAATPVPAKRGPYKKHAA